MEMEKIDEYKTFENFGREIEPFEGPYMGAKEKVPDIGGMEIFDETKRLDPNGMETFDEMTRFNF
jgi:hypothetical protein